MSLDPVPDAAAIADPHGGRLGKLLRLLRPRRSLAPCAAAFVLGAWISYVAMGGRSEGAGCAAGSAAQPASADNDIPEATLLPGLDIAVRPAPKGFPRGTRLPAGVLERDAAGAVSPASFSPGRDLVFVDDPRCWWECDFDGETDDECDRSMHAAAEIPFRRLVNLVAKARPDLQLRVQEAYRPTAGIHAPKSLHSEGRALDLTLGLPDAKESLRGTEGAAALELLASLAWQAGFDWVYNENPKNGGPHVHASVRSDAPRLRHPPTGRLHQ